MRAVLYRTDPAVLIAALGAPDLLQRYLAVQAEELPVIADRQLGAFLRRMNVLASRALAGGITLLARQDAAHADALLTDLFAVATWHGWELPVERLDADRMVEAGWQRGLLGADPGREGAGLWVVDHATVALARHREAADAADWHHHDHPCT